MYVTVVFLVYMDKIFCSNSDINQEAIGRRQQLRGNGVAIMGSTQQSVAIVIINQYLVYLGNESNMTAKFFDTYFTCDGTMYTYLDDILIMLYFFPKLYYYVYFSVHFFS